MRNSSTVTGATSLTSACTTVIGRPSTRTSKMLIDEPLITRSRTRSPGRNSAVQLARAGWPLIRYVYVAPLTSRMSVGLMRILPHSSRSATVAAKALALRVLGKGAERTLPVIVVVALEFEIADDGVGALVAPVRQHHDIVAVEHLRVAAFGHDDDRPVYARLFLEAGMAVIPVGAALAHREPVDEAFAGRDAAEAKARHAVHWRRCAHAMPVDRARLAQAIGDGQRHGIAFA